MILFDVISALFGVLMIINPGVETLAAVWMISTYTAFFGALLVILALRLRKTSTPKV